MSMEPTVHFDVVVVGAGIEGSATAYNLSKRGYRVALIEQFSIPHSRGSSHGQTRITRKAYPEHFYTQMMDYCTQEWRNLQDQAGEILYKVDWEGKDYIAQAREVDDETRLAMICFMTEKKGMYVWPLKDDLSWESFDALKEKIGYLAIGEHDGEFLRSNISSMSQYGMPYTVYSPAAFRQVYPMLRYGDETGGVFDPDGGILMADKALRAMQASFLKVGGTLRDSEKVRQIFPGETIHIITSKGKYSCKAVILACGPWANSILKDLGMQLPLKPVRISVCYWPEKEVGSHNAAKLPTFFEEHCCLGYSIYGLPSEEYPGHVKICLHGGPDIDPESRDTPDSQWVIDGMSEYVRNHFPGLECSPSIVETCIYTNTSDRNLILDSIPQGKNIIVGAGFSGHGFKLAPAVGQILADLATGNQQKFDISPFRLTRFPQSSKAKL